MTYPTLLPPRSSKLEKALEQVAFALTDVPTPVRDIWSPSTCPIDLLPWLAWGLSIDIWDSDWSEARKREAVADAIQLQRRKETPASLRTVLDRFDPLLKMVEWFEDPDTLDPYKFRVEIPLMADSDVDFSEGLVAQIVRDIAQVKPVRAHMMAVHRLAVEARGWIMSGTIIAGVDRFDMQADQTTALDPQWDAWLQTEHGEPLLFETGTFWED